MLLSGSSRQHRFATKRAALIPLIAAACSLLADAQINTGRITGVPTAAGRSGVTIGVSRPGGPVGARSYTVAVAAS